MADLKKQEEVKEEVVEQQVEAQPEEVVPEQVQEEVVKEDRPEINYKAELERLRSEREQLRMELERRSQPAEESPEDILRRMNDNELRSYLALPQYAVQHGLIQDILDERKFTRYQRKQEETRLKLDSEIERQKKYPETMNPSHPMAIRMSELMYLHRLDNSPSGRLVAAQLASIEFEKAKAEAAGRKKEQSRQADVKANFQGETSRPAPKVSDKNKLAELKRRADQGDQAAKQEYLFESLKRKGAI